MMTTLRRAAPLPLVLLLVLGLAACSDDSPVAPIWYGR